MPPRFSTTHADLGTRFYDPVQAASFPQCNLRHRHDRMAKRVGLDGLSDADWIEHFGCFAPFKGSFEQPLALRYHGHQFQVYNPDLGDGRGFLFAQLHDLDDGRLLDLGTKGSGQTPYSRNGDGRLTLKGGVREVLATAQLEALGVTTSASFSLIETGEALQRHDEPSPTRSAVLVRLSHSHIRIGTFQRLAFEEDQEALAALIDHCCAHYYPDIQAGEVGDKALALFDAVLAKSARLTAQWMVAGFVHGVLNTDNINVTGESFDYGPYRFLPHYEPGFTAAYFDERGLYSYGRQPQAMHWNLCRFAECLLDFVDRDHLAASLDDFIPQFENFVHDQFCRRLGVQVSEQAEEQTALVSELMASSYRFLRTAGLVPDQFFHDWLGGLDHEDRAGQSPDAEAYQSRDFEPVRATLKQFRPNDEVPTILASEAFQAPKPVTLLYNEIEALWAAIDKDDDWAPFQAKLTQIEGLRQALQPIWGKG